MQLKDVTPIISTLVKLREAHPAYTPERYSFGVKLPNQHNQSVRGAIRMALRCIEQAPVIASYKSNLLSYEEAVEDDYYLERKGDEYVDMALNTFASYHEDPCPEDVICFKTHEEDHVKLYRSDYNKTWRCWRFRPSQAERDATPWKDTSVS